MPITRFAPSPTGHLHLGHAYSALFAAHAAKEGAFLLRIEDIDPVRSKPIYTQAIFEDLKWLGLSWGEPVRVQSEHMSDYIAALDGLKKQNLIYPCFCTRKDIQDQALSAVHAPHSDDMTVIYPGTCRHLSEGERKAKLVDAQSVSWRLDVAKAQKVTGPLHWHDVRQGKIDVNAGLFGDVVLARKDVPTSYHLSVTVDDHLQGITLVTRGEDLFLSTHIHRLLQALLGYETPNYHHHALQTDASQRRYAKRDQSITLRALREAGETPETIRGRFKDAV